MSVVAVELEEATVLRGSTRAVDGVSLEIYQGQWFGLIGANGSGKTSLLRALAGRLPSQMGACRINGEELREQPEQRARRIGFMPPAELLPGALTCRQVFDLIEPDTDKWQNAIRHITGAIGLARLLDQRIGDCSAGMRQRIAIGCAFATGSAIIILDEPFNWLDPVAAVDLRKSLRDCVGGGLTLITALHDMLTLASCDRGVLLGRGKIVAELEDDEVQDGRKNPFAFEARIIDILRQHSQFT